MPKWWHPEEVSGCAHLHVCVCGGEPVAPYVSSLPSLSLILALGSDILLILCASCFFSLSGATFLPCLSDSSEAQLGEVLILSRSPCLKTQTWLERDRLFLNTYIYIYMNIFWNSLPCQAWYRLGKACHRDWQLPDAPYVLLAKGSYGDSSSEFSLCLSRSGKQRQMSLPSLRLSAEKQLLFSTSSHVCVKRKTGVQWGDGTHQENDARWIAQTCSTFRFQIC